MEYARRLIAHPSRILRWRLNSYRQARRFAYRRPTVRQRMAARYSSAANRLTASRYRLAYSIARTKMQLHPDVLRSRLQDRRLIVRAGAAIAGLALLMVVISQSQSTTTHPKTASARGIPALPTSPTTPTADPPVGSASNHTSHRGNSASPASHTTTAPAVSHPATSGTSSGSTGTPNPTTVTVVHQVTVPGATTTHTVTKTVVDHSKAVAPASSVPAAKTQPTGSSGNSSSNANTGSTSSTPGAISATAYAGLTINQMTMGSLTRNFGSTATPSQLSRLLGSGWRQMLFRDQVSGESCVYYLDSGNLTAHVFQLCFNSSKVLVGKNVIKA